MFRHNLLIVRGIAKERRYNSYELRPLSCPFYGSAVNVSGILGSLAEITTNLHSSVGHGLGQGRQDLLGNAYTFRFGGEHTRCARHGAVANPNHDTSRATPLLASFQT